MKCLAFYLKLVKHNSIWEKRGGYTYINSERSTFRFKNFHCKYSIDLL